MRRIEVADSPIQEPRFSTPEAAIQWSIERDARHQNPEISVVLGKPIELVRWNETSLTLYIAQSCLRLRSGPAGIYSAVVDRDVPSVVVDHDAVRGHRIAEDEPVEVRFTDFAFEWNRAELARQLLGNCLRRVSGSPAGLYIDISDFGILYVSPLLSRPDGRPLILWGKGD